RARVTLFIRTCEALSYAHRHGILHQDIKASAILIDDEGQPNLLDFGLASMLGTVGHAGAGKNDDDRYTGYSPGYAAPELLHGAPPSVAIDIHALGVLLYVLLCGRKPGTFSEGPLLPLSGIDKAAPVPSRIALDATPSECRRRQQKTPRDLSRVLNGDLDRIAAHC